MPSSTTHRLLSRSACSLALFSLLLGLTAFSLTAQAQDQSNDHIVSSQALQQQVQTASATRQQNIGTLTQFLSTPLANRAMQSKHIDAVKVRTAIPTLSDAELADLASRARDAQQQFAAGFLGVSMLLLIVLAIVVIVVVAAVH